MKFVAVENGRIPEKNLFRLHVEWRRREIGTLAVEDERSKPHGHVPPKNIV